MWEIDAKSPHALQYWSDIYLVEHNDYVCASSHDRLSNHDALHCLGLHAFSRVYDKQHHVHYLGSTDDGANERSVSRAVHLQEIYESAAA